MDIILQKKWNYSLSKDGSDLYLSVLLGSVGMYEINIKLNDDETTEFNQKGEEYIDKLSEEIKNQPSKWIVRSNK